MKLYEKQRCIDARHQFFSNRIVDIWNSLPAAVVLSPSVAVFKRNLAKLTSSSFYVTLNNMCLCVFMYFMSCILLRCQWLFGPFDFNRLPPSARAAGDVQLVMSRVFADARPWRTTRRRADAKRRSANASRRHHRPGPFRSSTASLDVSSTAAAARLRVDHVPSVASAGCRDVPTSAVAVGAVLQRDRSGGRRLDG